MREPPRITVEQVITALRKACSDLLVASTEITGAHQIDQARLERAQQQAREAVRLVNQLP